MMDFKPLTLDDKKILDKFLKPYTFNTCEYSFTNLFIWRKALDIQYAICNNILIIKKTDFSNNYHFMQPVGYTKENLKEIIDFLFESKEVLNLQYFMKDVEESFIQDLNDVFPNHKFTIEEDRDNSDYIYESSKLISLSGKKLHKKKNNYNHFIKNYKYSNDIIKPENIELCIKAAIEWCHKSICKGYLLHELSSIKDLLENISELELFGMVVYIKDKLSAFTIGEKMNNNMAIIHIEKADPDIRGLYTYINQVFAERYFKNVTYINREQDLGIEGLRKAKMSYMPAMLAKKFIIK
ncbi:DUF2156 domain-containing protein [Clostridium sp. DJ247]|uniref:DUF2156 domain-containing protein n=1 Tax=Clostridium sp. DJ247 TaxID=2726188 RepID=UPI001628698A|nr:phosphatidylglycerol lysyltransferase domain-containing protein [Clostridium sp. DJ247]MBC2582247.1 DUF2156 domain-containing protein [Clostridium sp. DJ247]